MTTCPDCENETRKRALCRTCKYLVCGYCLREHRQGNDQISGGCTAHMDAVIRLAPTRPVSATRALKKVKESP